MPSSNYPFGISATTSVRTVAGEVYCNTLTVVSGVSLSGTVSGTSVSASGSITGALGSVYGGRSPLVHTGSVTVTITSALYNSNVMVVPYNCYAEVVLVSGATANITRAVRVVAGTDSTGTDVTTLSVGSGTAAASTLYTTIGAVVLTQGSHFLVSSAVTATANTAELNVNLIAVAS